MYQLDDITDSRDVIARLNELQEERDALVEGMADDGEVAETALNDWDDEYKEELDALVNLCDGCSIYDGDWTLGTSIIRDSYFTEYAKDLAADISGAMNAWPCNHIDWDAAAEELKNDYSEIIYDGDSYYVRIT